jgi:hypothetical protein
MATMFNFTPTPIGASGSYDTSDWASLLGGAYTGGVAGAAAGAGVNEAVGRLQALGQAGSQDYANLARTATQGIDFKPYTLTSALGTTQQTAPGVISQQLTPQQQANVNAAQAQQASLYGAAVPNTSGISNQAFGSAGGYLNPQGNAQMQQLSGMFGNMAQQAGAAYGAPTGLEGTTGQALRGASTGLNQIGAGLGAINQYGAQALAQGTQGLGQIGSGMESIDAFGNKALAQGTAGLNSIGAGMGSMQTAANQAITAGTAGMRGIGSGMQDLAGLRGQYGAAAGQAAGMLGGSTTDMANQLFQQQQAMRNPEQQRQSAELENRLRAQGRLGTSTAAYGGTPEQLAMAKAVQEQQSADAFNSMTQAEQMAASQQARALGLGSATAGMATTMSGLTNEQQNRALNMLNAGVNVNQAISGLTNEQQARALALSNAGLSSKQIASQLISEQQSRATNLATQGISAQQAASGLTNEQQARALGLLSAGQQGTTLQDQLLSSQLGRATSGAQASSALAAANQALRQGDVQTAASLFNIGQAAAQLPQQMQGQNIAQAGQLQAQALAPASQQLQQAQLAGQLGQQQSTSAYQAGGLFGQLAGAGLQERLTAESAAAATRTKQFDSILKSYASQGGKAGADAQAIQELVAKGVTLVGDVLMGKDGNILGRAVDFIGTTATAMWDSVASGAAMASNEVGDLINTFGDVVEGGGEAISSAWDVVTSWWDDL